MTKMSNETDVVKSNFSEKLKKGNYLLPKFSSSFPIQ